MNTEPVTELTIDQRIEQMAKNLAVASIFAQHPQQDDDYDRVLECSDQEYFDLEGFVLCEDYACDPTEDIMERMENEHDKLKGFAKEVLAIKRVWKLEYDWDGDSMCDVFIGTEAEANEVFISNINSIIHTSPRPLSSSSEDMELLNEALGEHKHSFWETHRPFMYYATMNEVTDGN